MFTTKPLPEELNVCFKEIKNEEGNYKTFEAMDDAMKGSKLYDIPAGALLFGKEIHPSCVKDFIQGAKSGFIINHKNKYLHRDVTVKDESIIVCTSRNSSDQGGSFSISLEEVDEIFEIIARQF